MARLLISIILFLLFSSSSWATIYYVRDGGGNSTQCLGTTNAVYPGSGINQPCAFNHPAYVLGGGTTPTTNLMASGDTLYIDGDSDITPGSQAQYMIGYGMPNTGGCNAAYTYSCILNGPPTGTSGNPTSIIGTGTHKPQLWGTQRAYQVVQSNNNYVNLQWLEITDHLNCAYNDTSSPSQECNYNNPPYGLWAEDGISVSGSNLVWTDVYVHGLGRYGVSTGNLGSMTLTRFYSIGNGYGGWTSGSSNTYSGTLTFNQPIIEWNGCVEAYPLTGGLDNPSNYTDCFGQNTSGYGDGLAFGNTTNGLPGNWTLIGPGSISWNTQDGFDILHGTAGNGTDNIDKMRFEGNAGQQLKLTGLNVNVTNSIIVGDCGWWQNSAQAVTGGMKYGDSCRAEGDGILINIENNSSLNFYNNTILTAGSGIGIDYKDIGNNGCNGSTRLNIYNNIALGGYWWLDDDTINPGNNGGNSQSSWTYASGNDGNGSGTCGSVNPTEDYNIVYNFKNSNSYCGGSHDKCGTLPGFISTIPSGTPGGTESTFYNAWSGITYAPIASNSPAINNGDLSLSFWNNSNDYYNVTRPSPPSIGGLELSSCAVSSFAPCFYNSDCCSGTCSNNVCTSGGGTVGSGVEAIIGGNSKITGVW